MSQAVKDLKLALVLIATTCLFATTGCSDGGIGGSGGAIILGVIAASEGGIGGSGGNGIDGGTGGSGGHRISGYAQKGPFVEGSEVTLQFLDANMEAVSAPVTTTTSDDLGTYQADIQGSGLLEVKAKGRFLDEFTGDPSEHEISLSALYNISDDTTEEPNTSSQVNVNVLTHLTHERIKHLMSEESQDFTTAQTNAENELKQQLESALPFESSEKFSDLSLYNTADNELEGNAYLLAVTSALYRHMLNEISENIGDPSATIDSVLTKAANDFTDNGTFNDTQLVTDLQTVLPTLNPMLIADNLNQFIGSNSDLKAAGINILNQSIITVINNSHSIGGTLSGLTGTVVLQNNGGDDLTLSANGAFTFNTAVNDLTGYAVSILSQPAGQTCWLQSESGTLAGADTSNVAVNCVAFSEGIIFEDPTLQACFDYETTQHGWLSIDDVTALTCSDFQITSADDIYQLTALTHLDLNNNNLSSIDLTNNPALTHLDLNNNNNLTSINLTNNTALTLLDLTNTNLTSIDLASNTALTSLYLSQNSLTSIALAAHTALEILDLSNNNLTSIDLANNAALTTLYLYSNNLNNIDLTANTALTFLDLYDNNLSDIYLTANTALTGLYLSSNNLSDIYLTANTALTSVNLGSNNLSDINLTANTALTFLELLGNNLSDINLTANTALTHLDLGTNNLSNIALATNTALTYLDLTDNPLDQTTRDDLDSLELNGVTVNY